MNHIPLFYIPTHSFEWEHHSLKGLKHSGCPSPSPHSWIFRSFTFSSLIKQCCIGCVSHLSGRRFPSAPGNHPQGCPQIMQVSACSACHGPELCNVLSTWLVSAFPLAPSCCQQHSHSGVTQAPQSPGSAATVLHVVFNFSPNATKPHMELQSTTWTGFQLLIFNICPCSHPWLGSLGFPEAPTPPWTWGFEALSNTNYWAWSLSPHTHQVPALC